MPDGQAITYSETTDILTGTGSGKMGLTLIGTGSTAGIITGTAPSVGSDTTFNFTIRASDTAGNNTDRAFSIGVISARRMQYTGLEVLHKVDLVQDQVQLGVIQDIILTHLVVVMLTQIDYVYMVMVLLVHTLDSITSMYSNA